MKTFCQLNIRWLPRLMRLGTLYENISKGVCQKKKYFERELIWCWARGGHCMFHSVSKRHFISLISFAALMIPLNCPVQAFHNRCLLWGDKTYDSELVSEFSLVISCTYLLPKQCFAQIRCLIHAELQKKK